MSRKRWCSVVAGLQPGNIGAAAAKAGADSLTVFLYQRKRTIESGRNGLFQVRDVAGGGPSRPQSRTYGPLQMEDVEQGGVGLKVGQAGEVLPQAEGAGGLSLVGEDLPQQIVVALHGVMHREDQVNAVGRQPARQAAAGWAGAAPAAEGGPRWPIALIPSGLAVHAALRRNPSSQARAAA